MGDKRIVFEELILCLSTIKNVSTINYLVVIVDYKINASSLISQVSMNLLNKEPFK